MGPQAIPLEERIARVERALAGRESPLLLEEALGDEAFEVRRRASAAAAQRLEPTRLVAMIARGDSLARRSAAMDALAQGGQRSVPALITGATGPDRSTALFCIQVLGRIDAPGSIGVLLATSSHRDSLLAQAAIEGLGRLRVPQALPMLLKASEGEAWLAFSAVLALGDLGDRQAVEPLRKLRQRGGVLAEAIDQTLARLERASPEPSPRA